MPEDEIAVVIPVYNNADGLARTAAALAREATPARVVIVDDGSTDATAAVADELAGRHEGWTVLHRTNAGPGAARNAGAEAAGDVDGLVFLDANDEPLPGWWAWVRDLGTAGTGLVHCDPGLAGDDERSVNSFGLLPGCFAVRTDVFEAVGGYDAQLRYGENGDLVRRCRRWCDEHGLATHHEPAVLLRIHDRTEPRAYDRKRLEAMEHLLRRDAAELADDRARRAKLAGIGAIAAFHCAERSRARRLAWVALRAEPGRLRHWTRVALMLVPPLGHRRWPAQTPATRR